MGRRGFAASNNSQKKLEGAKQDRLNNTVKPKGVPTMPRNLSDEGQKFWRKYVPKLVEVGLATEIDQPALVQLCNFWSIYVETLAALANPDWFSMGTNRAFSANVKAFDKYKELCLHFGMTPLSRNSLDLQEVQEADEFGL